MLQGGALLVTKFGEWAIQGELRLLFCEGAAAAGKGACRDEFGSRGKTETGKSL